MNKIIQLFFQSFFAFISIFCVLLDLIMSVILPTNNQNFDSSLIIQTTFFSVWVAVLTSGWGVLCMINHFRKPSERNRWADSENVLTMLTIYQIFVFILYTGTFIIDKDGIVGFSSWYKILKSVLEHWLLPVVFVGYFICFNRIEQRSNKDYVTHIAWKACIMPFAYMTYVLIRCVLLNDYADSGISHFPYKQFDPFLKPGFFAFVFIAASTFPLPIMLGFDLLSHKLSAKIPMHFKFNAIVTPVTQS